MRYDTNKFLNWMPDTAECKASNKNLQILRTYEIQKQIRHQTYTNTKNKRPVLKSKTQNQS